MPIPRVALQLLRERPMTAGEIAGRVTVSAAAIWLVLHGARRPVIVFVAPVCVVTVVAVLHWRLRGVSGDRAAWAARGSFFAMSYASICAAFQLMLVLIALKVIASPALPWVRLFSR